MARIIILVAREAMLRGCRVVRGGDWASRDKDGGEGGLGTVVEVNPKTAKVKVIWDTGHEGQAKAGHDAKFELLLCDNAPAGRGGNCFT